MTIQPFRGRVLVRRDEEAAVTSGGIIIPETARQKPIMGVVVAVGPGRLLPSGRTLPPAVEVGETVIVSREGGVNVGDPSERLMLVGDNNILMAEHPLKGQRLLLDRVLVEREPEEAMHGLLVIPETARKQQTRARVVAVGPGSIRKDGSVRPCDVKPGDRVLLQEWSPDVEVNGQKMTIVGELEIFGVLETREAA